MNTRNAQKALLPTTLIGAVAILLGSAYYISQNPRTAGIEPRSLPGDGWVNFESKKFSFTVSRPKELTAYECEPCGLFASGVYFAVEKIKNPEDAQRLSDYAITVDSAGSSFATLDEAVRAYQDAPAGITYIVKETTVDGLPAKALYYKQGSTPLAHIILVHNKKTFVFSFGNSLKTKPQKVLEGIVASFHFAPD